MSRFRHFIYLLVWLASSAGSAFAGSAADAGYVPPEEERAAELLGILRKADFASLESKLTDLRISRERTPEGVRMFDANVARMSEMAADEPETYRPLLDRWCETSLSSFLPFFLRGSFYVEYAWKARGHGWAPEVKRADARLFAERLEKAEKDLLEAHRLDDSAAEPLARLVDVAIYGGLGDFMKYFRMAKERDPANSRAYFSALNGLTPRWGGHRETMFRFARASASSHSEDPIFGLLVLDAHADSAAEYDKKGKYIPGSISRYVSQSDVWTEIEQRLRAFTAVYPKAISKRNAYLQWALDANQFDFARSEFEAIGEQWDPSVWGTREKFDEAKHWLEARSAEKVQTDYEDLVFSRQTADELYRKAYDVYWTKRKYAEGAKLFEKVIAMSPHADAYYGLADYYRAEKHDLPKAVEYYRKALEINPDHAFAKAELTRTLAAMGKKEGS